MLNYLIFSLSKLPTQLSIFFYILLNKQPLGGLLKILFRGKDFKSCLKSQKYCFGGKYLFHLSCRLLVCGFINFVGTFTIIICSYFAKALPRTAFFFFHGCLYFSYACF